MANTLDFRQGYSDALDLIESVGIELGRLGEPPAMSDEYRKGWRTACNVMSNR